MRAVLMLLALCLAGCSAEVKVEEKPEVKLSEKEREALAAIVKAREMAQDFKEANDEAERLLAEIEAAEPRYFREKYYAMTLLDELHKRSKVDKFAASKWFIEQVKGKSVLDFTEQAKQQAEQLKLKQ